MVIQAVNMNMIETVPEKGSVGGHPVKEDVPYSSIMNVSPNNAFLSVL